MAGRNDPCPCGSGKKYKKCCLLEREKGRSRLARASTFHALDEEFHTAALRAALQLWGQEWFDETVLDFTGKEELEDEALSLFLPWLMWHYRHPTGTGVAELYATGRSLSATEERLMETQARSWLSLWEIESVDRGAGLTLRDLLTGETRYVVERSGTETAAPRLVLLARVVDWEEDLAVMAGCHSRPLTPLAASEVRDRLAEELGGLPLSVDRLKDHEVTLNMVDLWEEEAEQQLGGLMRMPKLSNMDGEPLVMVERRYRFAPEHRSSVLKALSTLEGAHTEELEDEGVTAVTVSRARTSDKTFVVGTLRAKDQHLVLHVNSLEREELLSSELEQACGALLELVDRSEEDRPERLASRLKAAAPPPGPIEEIPVKMQEQLIREFKQKQYASWPDENIPALDGRTPREAAKEPRMRDRLDALLKDMEYHESRLPRGQRYDFSQLREELGLPV